MNIKFKTITNILLTVILVFSILMISTIIITKTKFIYYSDITNLEIQEMSGLKETEIKLNYNYTINYLFDNTISEFKPPTISSSSDGSQHFKEVRNLFNRGIIILKTSLILGSLVFIIAVKNNYLDFKFLKHSSIIILCIPLLSLLFINVDFTFMFTIFHKLLFNNDKWLLDPSLDPIINIMPEEFFAHSAIGIVLLSSLIAIIFLITYYLYIKKYSLRKRKI